MIFLAFIFEKKLTRIQKRKIYLRITKTRLILDGGGGGSGRSKKIAGVTLQYTHIRDSPLSTKDRIRLYINVCWSNRIYVRDRTKIILTVK